MIDILMKLGNKQSLIVESNGQIHAYEQSIEEVMNIYLQPLLLSFRALSSSAKSVGENKYLCPLSYYTEEGLNILVPTGSIRRYQCCWVSLNYCLTHNVDTFNKLTQMNISQFQWGRILTKALEYKNKFHLDIDIPAFGMTLTEEQMHELIVKDCR